MRMTVRGIIFFGIYLFLVTLPLGTALISNPSRTPGTLLVNIAIGAGFLGYSLMALEFALISRIKPAAQPFGEDALQLFHNWMGVFALLLPAFGPFFLIAYRPGERRRAIRGYKGRKAAKRFRSSKPI